MSFREKSLWLTFTGLTLAFGYYFAQVLPGAGSEVLPAQVGLFIVATILLVAAQIAGHVVIAIADRRTDSDERDRHIELLGVRNGSLVLAAGVFGALCTAVLTEGNFLFSHVLLGSWVAAQLVETGSQLILHRRGT